MQSMERSFAMKGGSRQPVPRITGRMPQCGLRHCVVPPSWMRMSQWGTSSTTLYPLLGMKPPCSRKDRICSFRPSASAGDLPGEGPNRRRRSSRGDVPLPNGVLQLLPRSLRRLLRRVSLHLQADESRPAELWEKVFLLGVVFFCASFNLSILQNLKDSIMVVAGGAETLPFLASFCVLPASIGFFILYGQLVSVLHERAVFYAAVLPLLAFYTLFASFLYPAAPSLHPTELVSSWMAHTPLGLHGLLKVVSNWVYSLFFCLAELWGSVVISVLFWSLANEVCNVEEAKQVYPLMGISANIALVIAGAYIKMVTGSWSQGDTLTSLRLLVGTVVVMSGVMFLSKRRIDVRVLGARQEETKDEVKEEDRKKKKKKKKGSFAEGMEVLKNSSKIRNLALLVMGYGISHRLFEFTWKGQLKVLHDSVQSYQSVLADVASLTGITTILLMLTSRLVFQNFGWGVAAIATPVVMGLTGLTFFTTSMAMNSGVAGSSGALVGLVVAACSVTGVATQVFARSSKFSLFDPAKEMVYIELGKDEKSRGKAAVDLVGSQIGKSGASWITQVFLLMFGSIKAAMPFTTVVFVVMIGLWMNATRELNQRLKMPGPSCSVDDRPVDTIDEDSGNGIRPAVVGTGSMGDMSEVAAKLAANNSHLNQQGAVQLASNSGHTDKAVSEDLQSPSSASRGTGGLDGVKQESISGDSQSDGTVQVNSAQPARVDPGRFN